MERRLEHKRKRAALEANMTTLCKKFKIHEWEEHVLPIFREVTKEHVLYLLKRNKKTITMEHIGQALITIAKDEPYAFLEDMYYDLSLKHKILHSKTHTWYAFKLIGVDGKPVLLTAMQISEGLKNSFRSLASAPRVKVELFNQFTWVMIIQKKRKSSEADAVHMTTFVYTPGERYIFASERNLKEDISKGLLSTFGYRILSDCNLSASDIPSMIILLRNKAGKAFDAHSVQHTVAPYAPGPGVATENGMDYTDLHLKKKYTNMIFGEDCPVLKNFIVKEVGQKVKNKQTCRTSLMIRANNIFEFLKILFVRGVLVIPVTPFIERIRILGKNHIEIKAVSGNSTQSEQQN